KRQAGINRGISIFIVLILALFLVALVIYSIIPQLIDSVTTLARNADSYIRTVNQFIDKFSARFNLNSDIFEGILGSSQELFKKITQYFSSALPKIFDFSLSVGSGISNFIIGFILSIYMLNGKERFSALFKKLMYALLPEKTVKKIINLAKYTHSTFGNYLTGQLLDAAILGIICFILMSIFGMEYALLISMTVAITNIIPFIGPFIGAIPSAFILLMVQPSKVIWFIVMILVLQQIDGNLLAPKIVGKTTGLSSFWIIFSILLGGGLFGIAGVLLAVPTFSVIHLILNRYIKKRLSEKNLPTGTKDYL
ncbi:MAG: AI-2E family transporter, partial [Oscillospiraceae bacterium]|nr:AI-2E family transporter [Oscillospiraceae bacterium]